MRLNQYIASCGICSRREADRLVQAIAFENMTEEEFRKATRSLRPYVAKVYGW